jgi:PHD/YefM family antitoxin component YafN of YafNO toxin-antitoxin module
MDETVKKIVEHSQLTSDELTRVFNFVILSAEAYENVKSAMSEEELRSHEVMKSIADKLRRTATGVDHSADNYFTKGK